jgi:hypothetical protein
VINVLYMIFIMCLIKMSYVLIIIKMIKYLNRRVWKNIIKYGASRNNAIITGAH